MVRDRIEVYLQKMTNVLFRANVILMGMNYHFEISVPTEKYGVYDINTKQLIKLCDTYNMAFNYCNEMDYEVMQ